MMDIRSFDENDPMLDEMLKLNCAVFTGFDYTSVDLEQFRSTLHKHMTYPGFVGVKAMNGDAELIGFAYGYESRPEQFYRGKLEDQLSAEQTKFWLSDCFEFVELAVAASARNRGVGSKLHDALLGQALNTTSVLTTNVDNTPAIRLYKKKGWEVIGYDAPVLSDDNLQLIMAKKCR
ncbi:GNAT family N-acetyltransferase [Virgibacillus ihumii]|uniref:GNAT family N-acetyltransferase n=1 Tax=Virgibacillus ihumii TaxID=2686091 RepID=UPI00157CD9CC|nr:GNAT family N-acetyltransferase [Virgibacillus ihumii]